MSRGVTLQVNLAPRDLPHARWTLPHQLRVWGAQVDEILFSLDVPGARSPQRRNMDALLDELCSGEPAARVAPVDPAPEAVEAVAREFFDRPSIPSKDTKGAPFYPYFHGLHAARNDHVLHLDSDMMFGGGSATWIEEAVALLAERSDVVVCSPLPGPPRADGTIDQPAQRLDSPYAFRFPQMSTRVFMIDRAGLRQRVGPLDLDHPVRLHRRIKARLNRRPGVVAAEMIMTAGMRAAGVVRDDFLGREPGMWSLHPLHRSERFYAELPSLIARIERGEVPDEQRGRYDVHTSLFDFSVGGRQSTFGRIRA